MSMITKAFILHFLGVILLSGFTPGEALVRRYKFVLRNTSYTRLCSTKTILTINGKLPGPTIYARKGDLVIVDVHNRAGHNITIHWHGVKLPRYPWSDGPEYVTQCPIQSNTKFRQHIFLSDEEGTLWWHAHSEWSRATVYGALVILPEKRKHYPFPKPHGEVPILIDRWEWWKADIQQIMEEFLANGGDPNISDSFLINGLPGDRYPCSKKDMFNMTVEYGKTYLLRVVNAVMNNIMFFKVANHSLTVVGSDASYTKHINSDYIAIAPGQTIDVLLEANQPPSHYYMAARVFSTGGAFDSTTTTGLIVYDGSYPTPPPPPLPILPNISDVNASVSFTRRLRSLANKKYPVDVPVKIDTTLFFTLSINSRPCPNCTGPVENERLLASVNNITLLLPTISFLQAYYNNISGVYDSNFPNKPPLAYNYTEENVPRELWRPENGTRAKILEFNSTVELVFQGTNSVAGIDHPMHLHGHSFYVVGSGPGNFDKDIHPGNYNLVDPPLMETIAVQRNGWTAIRFRANNPGVWFMHCHFERHVSWGMGMVFITKDGKGPNDTMLPTLTKMPPC